ncbi:MAG: endonuclease/exonuclease/phosphatase family protein [Candidatus Gastranaerophilaceae bacterium]|jgi:endonuclease/exonuclease/phosphatase family metal-dependent hydrolase
MKKNICWVFLILLLFSLKSFAQEFSAFTFNELVSLSASLNQPKPLLDKIDMVLNTPVVDNSINPNEVFQPKVSNKIGPYIRVSTWNIDRGFDINRIKYVFVAPDKLLKNVNEKIQKDPKNIERIKEQINILKNTDVLFLNEVDLGMPRTNYKDIAKELAKTTGYNYAYGIEFIEVDPSYLGTGKNNWSEKKSLQKDNPTQKVFKLDKKRYKGFHGNAILSKFPLQNVRIIRLPLAYNWYSNEKEKITKLEEAKRTLSEKMFEEYMLTEVRLGSRMALIADINIPEFDQKITLVCIHIENRTRPENRAKQIKYLLDQLKHIDNPIILTGDFNTTMVDGSSTSIQKELKNKIKDPHFIAKTALLYGNPYGFAINATSEFCNFVRLSTNPASRSIPVFASNPERKTFNVIKDFKFNDGHYFDTRGDKDKSIDGKSGFLANSNEKRLKGFVPTFIFKKDYGLLKYKLDWIFVKDYVKNSADSNDPYKFAPHFGRTLFDLNFALNEPLSDHAPITVDLPLTEYKK